MPKVTILCGLSPLPVCQALKTLAADEVVILHGQGRAKTVHAPHVAKYCFDILKLDKSKVHLVEVDAFNPLRCQAALEQKKTQEVLASSTLVYGPGTAVMNALIFDSWANANPSWQKQQFWYLQANPSQLLPSNKEPLEKDDKGEVLESEKTKRVVATGLNSAGLVNLHLLQDPTSNKPEFTLMITENFDPFADLKPDEISVATAEIGQGVEDILYKGISQATKLSPISKKWLAKFLPAFPPPFQDGFFMEAVIFHVLKRGFNPDQIIHSFEVRDNDNKSVLEMDVLLRKGDNHLWISSHTNSANNKWNKSKNRMDKKSPYSDFRKKFFEAKENAVRLSGREARSITIVNRSIENIPRSQTVEIAYEFEDRIRNGKLLRRRLGVLRRDEHGNEKEYDFSDRHIIVDLAELLGENPAGVVQDTANQLGRNATQELISWISNALDH